MRESSWTTRRQSRYVNESIVGEKILDDVSLCEDGVNESVITCIVDPME